MHIRKLERDDKEQIRTILVETDVFKPEEIEVALELMDIFLNDPNQKDYYFYTAVDHTNTVLGYTCVGPTALTTETFDLYWIVVKPSVQHNGIGKQLLAFTEEWVRSRGGRLLIAETSSTEKYDKARKFYLTAQFQEVARIKDYYKIGDDLIIFGKYLSQHGATS